VRRYFIFVLGRFEVTREERVLPAAAWTRRKAAALLQRLALERRPLKDQAIEFLWPEADPTSGANNLYRTLHALRRTLDATLGPGTADATLTFADGVLSLSEAVWVDVREFELLCAAASGVPSRLRRANLEQALALYVGDLLPDERYVEWTLAPREALRSRRREASLALAAEWRDTNEYTRAAAPFNALLTALYRERLSETLHLSPLSEDAVTSVVAHILGGAAAPDLMRAVYEITEGNPFFVEEITRALLKSDQVEAQAGQWRLQPTTELCMPADLAQLQVGETVLDVGCGTGTLALIAKRRVGATDSVSGIDPSVQMIARARRKAARRGLAIDFQVGVVERLAFPDQSFDVVLSSFMMHQLPDGLKRQGLAEIVRVLKPGGRLLVVDTRRPEEQRDRPARPIHIGPWNSGIQDQPALMQAAGFSQIETGKLDTGTRRLPEIGFALGRISRAGAER
jgi:SAM-dependent methyltransferase/DNA-binding SARP family transcriptional activator